MWPEFVVERAPSPAAFDFRFWAWAWILISAHDNQKAALISERGLYLLLMLSGRYFRVARNQSCYSRPIASACRMLRITVCARLSTTATSPSSKLKGSGANTMSSPTVSRS